MFNIIDIDVSTKTGAEVFLSYKKAFEEKYGSDPGSARLNHKPIAVRFHWFYEKVKEARKTLKQNIWQMSYTEAVKIERGLKYEIWERLIKRHR